MRSKLEYASAAWDPYLHDFAKDIMQLESVQRRGARFVMKDHQPQQCHNDAGNTGMGLATGAEEELQDRMPWITALVEYGPSNTAHVKYGPPIDSHYIVLYRDLLIY